MTPAELADISQRAYRHMAPWSEAQFKATLSQNNHLLACSNHAFVLGQIILDEAEILAVATDPDHQRKGEAHRAYQDFRTKAVKAGVETVFLEVAKNNDAAIAFYEKLGFASVGLRKKYYTRADGQHIDALIMSANIA